MPERGAVCRRGEPVSGPQSLGYTKISLLTRKRRLYERRVNVIHCECVSDTAVTALTQPSLADTVRRRCHRATLNPALTAPPVGTTRVTTPVNAGLVGKTTFFLKELGN